MVRSGETRPGYQGIRISGYQERIEGWGGGTTEKANSKEDEKSGWP